MTFHSLKINLESDPQFLTLNSFPQMNPSNDKYLDVCQNIESGLKTEYEHNLSLTDERCAYALDRAKVAVNTPSSSAAQYQETAPPCRPATLRKSRNTATFKTRRLMLIGPASGWVVASMVLGVSQMPPVAFMAIIWRGVTTPE